jgi:hypothetical protein
MNKIVLMALVLTVTSIIALTIYFIPFFSKKKIRKGKFDLLQFINLFFAPLLIIPIFYFFRQMISQNPEVVTIRYPKYVSEIVFLTLLYFMVLGNGIHAVSVVLSKHMKDLRKHSVWEINEFFHHAFSHLIIFVPSVIFLFSLAIYEINRPNLPLTNIEVLILVISGILVGIVLGMASIEGSIAKIMFIEIIILLLLIPLIFVFFNLDFRRFPFTIFVESLYITTAFFIALYGLKRKGFPEIVPHHFFED